jgi:hypothetical protein
VPVWVTGTAGSVAGYGAVAGRLAELTSAAYASIVVERP